MTPSQETASGPAAGPSRRIVMATLGAAGCAAALTACGGSGSDDKNSSQPAGAAGDALAHTSDIPVGGGKIFEDAGVVVTQPTAGKFKAFSNRCTHKQCPVSSVEGGTINCPCHGSRFDITDGSVKGGPAPKPLPSAEITVTGGSIELA
ncbi:Rieske (2Fe-2S) protein [Streptomyces sp. NPDC046465]|uniref:Rieske (2Fe-2S) protein n=1 Tax=Streptomyces sp. NPDC046465 TaxID=3155810 RepID=UPI0033F815AA